MSQSKTNKVTLYGVEMCLGRSESIVTLPERTFPCAEDAIDFARVHQDFPGELRALLEAQSRLLFRVAQTLGEGSIQRTTKDALWSEVTDMERRVDAARSQLRVLHPAPVLPVVGSLVEGRAGSDEDAPRGTGPEDPAD